MLEPCAAGHSLTTESALGVVQHCQKADSPLLNQAKHVLLQDAKADEDTGCDAAAELQPSNGKTKALCKHVSEFHPLCALYEVMC